MNKRFHDSNKLALILVSSVGINFDLMLTFQYACFGAGNQSSIIFVVILSLLFSMKLLKKYLKLESI